MSHPKWIQMYLDTPTRVMREDGTYMTRGEIIAELQERGTPAKYITRYLAGLDRGEEIGKWAK